MAHFTKIPLTWGASLLVLTMALFAMPAAADDVKRLLASEDAPDGVVFEIVEDDEDALSQLIPRVLDAIAEINLKFPGTEFAVVSHGREEFALHADARKEYADVHESVISLVDNNIPVHVCETHAGWYGVSAEDFPDYVDVAPTGPGQIALYEELGYVLVRIE